MEAFPAPGKPPSVIARFDDQDPYVNNFQQVTHFVLDVGGLFTYSTIL